MTIDMTPEERQIERQQVEEVFRLGGGELNDKPLVCDDISDDGVAYERTYAYHYDGAPEYVSRELTRTYGYDVDMFTVVHDDLYGTTADVLRTKEGATYKRVAYFTSSGETECPAVQASTDECEDEWVTARPCPLCDAQKGEEHGHIYLGDGWGEAVYAKVSDYPLDPTCARVVAPGKFEGAPAYLDLFYEMALDGYGEEEEQEYSPDDPEGECEPITPLVTRVRVTRQHVAMYPALMGVAYVRVWEDDNGFVHHETVSKAEVLAGAAS